MLELTMDNIQKQKQLLKLQKMREKASEARYREARKTLMEAEVAYRQREQSIQKYKYNLDKAKKYLNSEELTINNSTRQMVNVRQYWTAYDLEKEEYYLQMDADDVEKAKEACQLAWQNLARMRAKVAIMSERLSLNTFRFQQKQDNDMELEQQEYSIQAEECYS